MNPYVFEKIRELDAEELNRRPFVEVVTPRRPTVFGVVAAVAGRALRRTGEGLESWATPCANEHDHRLARRAAR